jgi:hypothetical protein
MEMNSISVWWPSARTGTCRLDGAEDYNGWFSTKISLQTEPWPGAQDVADEEDALGVGHTHFATDDVVRQDVAVGTDFGAAAPNRQRFADVYHLHVERGPENRMIETNLGTHNGFGYLSV